MGALGILGGIGKGVTGGVRDLERMDEAQRAKESHEFQKRVQGRQQEDWDEEDRIAREVRAVQTAKEGWGPGYEAVPAGRAMRDDEGTVMPGVAQVRRPQHEVDKDTAAIYKGSKRIADRTYGGQLETAARAGKKSFDLDEVRATGTKMLEEQQKDQLSFFKNRTFPHGVESDVFGPGVSADLREHEGKSFLVPKSTDGKPLEPKYGPIELTQQKAAELNDAYIQHLTGQRLASLLDAPEYLTYQNQQQTLGLKKDELAATDKYHTGALKQQADELKAKLPVFAAQAEQAYSDARFNDRRYSGAPLGHAAKDAAQQELVNLSKEWGKLTPEQQKGPEGKTIQQQSRMVKGKLDIMTMAGEGKQPTAEDISKFREAFADTPSDVPDKVHGGFVPIGKLPPNDVTRLYRTAVRGDDDAGGPGINVPDKISPAAARAALTDTKKKAPEVPAAALGIERNPAGKPDKPRAPPRAEPLPDPTKWTRNPMSGGRG